MRKIILASTSPTRKKLLDDAGIPYEAIASRYEEDMTLPLSPVELAKELSSGKARAVAEGRKEGIVIGADTFVVFGNKCIGKPHTSEKAKETLRTLRGKEHIIMTGYTIIDTQNGKSVSKTAQTKVKFRDFSDKEIEDYVATGEPLDKAGAYAVLGEGIRLVEKIEGSKSNIAGLPMEELIEVLKDFGV